MKDRIKASKFRHASTQKQTTRKRSPVYDMPQQIKESQGSIFDEREEIEEQGALTSINITPAAQTAPAKDKDGPNETSDEDENDGFALASDSET